MSPFATLLVPLDGTDHDHKVLPTAIDEALRHDARLVLLNIVSRPEPCNRLLAHGGPAPVTDYQTDSETRRERDRGVAYLKDIHQRFHLPDNVGQVVRVGDPARQIEQEAAASNGALVVLEMSTSSGNEQDIHRQLAEHLIHRGACELLVVDGPRHVQHLFDSEIKESADDYEREDDYEHEDDYVGLPT